MVEINSLKEGRKALHLSQRQLADMLGVTQQTICQYEQGKIRCDKFIYQKLNTIINTKFFPIDYLAPRELLLEEIDNLTLENITLKNKIKKLEGGSK